MLNQEKGEKVTNQPSKGVKMNLLLFNLDPLK